MTKTELMETYTAEQLADMVLTNQTKIEEFLRQEKTSDNYTMFLQSKLGDMEYEINKRETAIEQIDRIICELFGIAHNGYEYSDDFKELLRENSAVGKTVVDFLPTEPIKVADMLINAEGEYEHNPLAKALCGEDKGTYRIFDVSELRQIAEHLLVYCNHHKEEEE